MIQFLSTFGQLKTKPYYPMKKIYTLVLVFILVNANAQTAFQRVYNTLNTKCQNATCHSASAVDGSESLKFDGTESQVYAAILNVPSANANSVAKYEKLVKPQHPYMSFLLRKMAGASFDTDLSIDANEGTLMNDINGSALTSKEIEFVRQWIIYGAKQTYGGNDPQPSWQNVSDYYDNPASPFLTKPPKPAVGTGMQFRMGPIFLPTTGQTEQEWLQQQEVNFPYLAEVNEIDGFMNQQSHHFILFKYTDSLAATDPNHVDYQGNQNVAADIDNSALVSILTHTSFDGDKYLTAAWQQDDNLVLPAGTALMWEKHTYLDMNFHMKNYNATSVLPCDFYFNVLYKPRNPNTLPMISNLVNNGALFLLQGVRTVDHDDQDNSIPQSEVRYIWNMTGHTHKYGTGFDIYQRDTLGQLGDKIYDGTSITTYPGGIYADGTPGSWDHSHPPIEYFPDLLPIPYGKHNGHNSGLVSRATWNILEPFVTFSFQTTGEMELFYYMYTTEVPNAVTAINDDSQKGIYFQVMPNPMNDNGKLVYTLTNSAIVDASVIDITGKLVAQMTNETEDAGVHEINIGNAQKLSSGIYYARLSVNGTVYTKKFIVTE